ncbi:MAG: CPBP family intramembrane metalloprotease [Halanaerobiales bacterium]|nr:CPBP family intramembrane metalloprotease [Halanaerobiales bacterium]
MAINPEQHSIKKTAILHLLPGLLLLLFFIIMAPLLHKLGLPSMFTIYLAALLILIPFELGYLFYLGKKENNRFSLKGIVLCREKIPIWQYFVLVPVLTGWSIICFAFIAPPIDSYLIKTFFSWLPHWFFLDDFVNNISLYSKSVVIATWVLGLVLNGIGAPIVEELYFRGYLLPRIACLKRWGPLVNVLLFSLYHFFTPWQNPVRILALLPMVYVVWWKKNIYLAIFTHCLVNIGGVLTMIPLIFG